MNRNDPCPCGSGKKYKKCCGSTVAAAPTPEVARANAVKELDRQLTDLVLRFSRARFGPDWLSVAVDEYSGNEETIEPVELQLAVPWALFHRPSGENDPSVAQLFGDERGPRLAPGLRAVLDAQLASWLGVWEVERVEQGVGMAGRGDPGAGRTHAERGDQVATVEKGT